MAACSLFRPASSVPAGGSGMLVFATGRPIISVGSSGTTLPCPGLAVSSAATTTPLRSGNVLGISVPQAVWSLLPAASRGVVALTVPEGASGWGMLHSGDFPATSGEFDNIEEPGQDKEGLLLETGASGTFRPAASSVEVPEEVWRLLPEEDRGVVNFMVPATTEDEDALHKKHGLMSSSPTRAVGFYTVPAVGTCSGVRGLLFPFGPCFGVRGEGKRGAAVFAMPKHASVGMLSRIFSAAGAQVMGGTLRSSFAKLAEVRRQVTLMHVFVGDQNTNREVDNATRTCTGVLIDVVVAADLGREEWKMKMQDAVGMAVVFEELAAECRDGVVVNYSLKNGIRTIRKLAGLVASETVLRPSWDDDELREYAAIGKGLYFRALMEEFSELAEAVESAVAFKLDK
ncbi:uncharacterized protein LOC112269396 [Brachypodium distachyon]|uniref:uncharacterized protein LOC112269396 n=1 Tax=Brachypodium distachyon TaxID=15368 RepID=UPI000D0D347F|nr:uncharacterized protein LOC112269396 [Brachypodium distachyon]|eukprot:XP_024311855.1 uncharacterized protein LOC112269396 [Brachypodium distachyon]